MFVRLVVSSGPNLGTIAEIREGYYLIGTHEECQIRSESQSIADRHCLLQHKGKHFGVCDLGSGRSTYVNHKPLKPKKWTLLNHGDLIQVGDVAFLVVITATDPAAPPPPKKRSGENPKRSGP